MLVAVFSACHRNNLVLYSENPSTKNLTQKQQVLLINIAESGVTVIKEGALYTFLISTDACFDQASRELRSDCENKFMLLAKFINEYRPYFNTLIVSVIGYTDKVWKYPAREKLSLHYAQSVANSLRENGVDLPLKVRGMGAANSIASNQYPQGTVYNRRVEVRVF